MKKTIVIVLAAVAVLAFASTQLHAASESGRDMMPNLAGIRHINSEHAVNAARIVRIEGLLSCDLGADNQGQGCALKLKENGTGKIFSLIEARTAMKLYLEGSKKVAIEGKLASDETIEVRNAQTL